MTTAISLLVLLALVFQLLRVCNMPFPTNQQHWFDLLYWCECTSGTLAKGAALAWAVMSQL